MTDEVKEVEQKADAAEVAAEAATEAAKEAEEKAEVAEKIAEAAEEKAEEAKEEAPKEEVKAEPTSTEAEKTAPTGKFADLIKEIEGLSALELSELVKALEERFGVSAAAPVAVAAGAPAAGGAAADEEKANYNVVLTNGGSNKIGAIKAVREILPDLGLVEALILGSWLKKVITKSREYQIDWAAVLIGVLAMGILKIVPVIGWILAFGFFLVTLGTVSNMAFGYIKNQKK